MPGPALAFNAVVSKFQLVSLFLNLGVNDKFGALLLLYVLAFIF
jgi:hypothetical protein